LVVLDELLLIMQPINCVMGLTSISLSLT